MASQSGVRAGKAFVVIEAVDKTSAILNNIGQRLQAFGAKVMGFGQRLVGFASALAAPFLGSLAHFTNFGDKLDKMSQRTGISVESLSTLKFAAEQSGSSLDAAAGIVQKMNRRLGRLTAGEGSNTQLSAMNELGISVQMLKRLNPEQRLLLLSEAMKNYGDDAAAAGLAQRAFGTGVDDLLPLLLQGAEGIRGLQKEAKELGLEVSGKQAKSAAEMADAWNRVKSTFKKAAFEVGAALAPALIKITNVVAKVLVGVIEWAQKNQGLIATIFGVIAAIAGVGVVLIATGLAISALGFAFTTVATVIGAVKVAVLALLSPFGLVVLAVAAVIAVLYAFNQAFRDAVNGLVGFLMERFGSLADTISTTFKGIVAAIQVGDIEAAFDVAVQGMMLLWKQVVDFMIDSWNSVTTFVNEAWQGTVASVKEAWFSAQREIAKGILELAEKSQLASDAFELISGVDVKEQSAKAKKLDAQSEALHKKRLAEFQELRKEAMANEGVAVYGDGDIGIEDIERFIHDTEEALGRPKTSFLDSAFQQIDEEFNTKIENAWKKAGDSVNKQREAIAKANEERAKEIQERREKLKETVDALEERAEQEALEDGLDKITEAVDNFDLSSPSVATPTLKGLEKGSVAAAEKFNENQQRPMMAVKEAVDEGNKTLEDMLNELRNAAVLREA